MPNAMTEGKTRLLEPHPAGGDGVEVGAALISANAAARRLVADVSTQRQRIRAPAAHVETFVAVDDLAEPRSGEPEVGVEAGDAAGRKSADSIDRGLARIRGRQQRLMARRRGEAPQWRHAGGASAQRGSRPRGTEARGSRPALCASRLRRRNRGLKPSAQRNVVRITSRAATVANSALRRKRGAPLIPLA